VLLVGNNYVGTANELAGCVADVQHARSYFAANVNPATFNLSFFELSDNWDASGSAVMVGANGTGTRANILKGFDWLLTGAAAGDVLYVHYSGHGTTAVTAEAGEVDHVDSCWVPLDYQTAGLIRDNELRTIANRVPSGATLWITSDSCHSGSVLDLRYSFADTSFRGDLVDDFVPVWEADDVSYDPRALVTSTVTVENRFYPATTGTVVLLSGCKDLQTSADAYEERQSQGAMSWALFSALKQDKTTALKYLVRDVRMLLKQHKYTQIPQLSSGTTLDLNTSFATLLKL
jgi:hypothetical protein